MDFYEFYKYTRDENLLCGDVVRIEIDMVFKVYLCLFSLVILYIEDNFIFLSFRDFRFLNIKKGFFDFLDIVIMKEYYM